MGTITALDLKASAPSLTIAGAGGRAQTLGVDPKTATAWQAGKMIPLEQLSVGQRVQVRFSQKDGRNAVKSIQIMSPKSTPSSAAPASTSY